MLASASQARIGAAYPDWVRAHDTRSDADLAGHRAGARVWATFSLIVPTADDSDAVLATLGSLRAQINPDWEACVVGNLPPALGALFDSRVRAIGRRGDGFAAAGNAGLAAAHGDFVAVLRPGERLAARALQSVAAIVARRPEAAVIYSDEDQQDASGHRHMPVFKTGWDPDLLLTHDYMGGLVVYRAGLLARIGGLRPQSGAAVLHDLALRATGTSLPDRIVHVPAVLFHRPAPPPVAAETPAVVQGFVGDAAEVVAAPRAPARNRLIWRLPSVPPLVSVIVPVRDRPELLLTCAAGVLRRTDYPALELLVVDNDSAERATHAAFAALCADPRTRVLAHPGAFNYAAINNAAVGAARGEVIVLLNSDTDVIAADWLRELVSQAMRPEVGAVGARLLYGDGSLQHGGVVLAPGGHAVHLERLAHRDDAGYNGQLVVQRSALAVTAACLAMRRSVFLEAGGFDARHFAVAFNDVDLCLRLRERGYRIVWTPYAELYHLESQSRGRAATRAERAREAREVDQLRRRWRHVFARDPFLNANLACQWDEALHLAPPRHVHD